MAIEPWGALALALLAVAAVARSLKLFRVAGPWMPIAMVARLAACLVLVLVLLQTGGGGGANDAPRREVLAAALATLVVYLVLVWRLRMDAAAPIVDLGVVALILTAYLAAQSSQLEPLQLQHGVFQQVFWGLLIVGVGGVLVAGSTGLMLALRTGLRKRAPKLAWPHWLDLHTLLQQATLLSLVSLGAGLSVSAWSAWRVTGTVATGGSADGLAWMAITWLLAAMGQLARGAGKRWECWTASLAVSSVLTALVGLLMLEAPAHLL
jgi:hypothetical protein